MLDMQYYLVFLTIEDRIDLIFIKFSFMFKLQYPYKEINIVTATYPRYEVKNKQTYQTLSLLRDSIWWEIKKNRKIVI